MLVDKPLRSTLRTRATEDVLAMFGLIALMSQFLVPNYAPDCYGYPSLGEKRTNVSSLAYLLLHYREPAKRQRFQEPKNAKSVGVYNREVERMKMRYPQRTSMT